MYDIPESAAGEYLNCGKVRNIVLNKCLLIGQGNGNSSSVSTPFVEPIPEIAQSEVLNRFSLPGVPQTVKVSNLVLSEKQTKTQDQRQPTITTTESKTE